MNTHNARIVFMGTPSFAVPSLATLVEHGLNVVAVITAPDKPKGRGQRKTYSPVKQYAIENNLLVLQPTDLKSATFLGTLKSLMADIQVVVAFRMLPEAVWTMPALGSFNLHASLLPHYRGAAPIPWAIINGERQTGVTTFFINHEIDTGNIIFQEKEPIYDTDDAGKLHDRLMEKGAQLVLKTVKAIAAGNCPIVPQPKQRLPKVAPKIFRHTCQIDWHRRVGEISNFVRGLSPYPGAWTTIDNKTFKVFKVSARALPVDVDRRGNWATDNTSYLQFRAADGWIAVEELQPEGKRRMTVETFFRGNKIKL